MLRDDWHRFGWLTGAVVARSILYFGVLSLVALYLIHQLGASTTLGSASLAVFIAAGAVGTVVGGALGDRLGRVWSVRIGYALVVPGLIALLLAPSLAVAFVAVAAVGFASFLPFAVQVTLGQEYLPNRIGTANGVTMGIAMNVGGLATPLLGLLADAHGLRIALAVLLVLPAVSLALSIPLREPRTVVR